MENSLPGELMKRKNKIIYIWKPDLKQPKDSTEMHIVELLRDKPKRGEKIDKNWIKARIL